MPTADELLGADEVARLLAVVGRAAPGSVLVTLQAAAGALGLLGLRARCDALRDALLDDLGADPALLDRAVASALEDPACTGWLVWPLTEAVSAAALADGGPKAFDAALDRLAALTGRLTSEFALRPLLEADLDRALPVVVGWTASPDPAVRRLASEGTRPLLPWATRVRAILADPTRTVPILTALHCDADEVVRRSVANHLNDLSRLDAELAVGIAAGWLAGDGAGVETGRVVRHGLRTLVKQGHPGALALLGYGPVPSVVVEGPTLDREVVVLGEEVGFRATLTNAGAEDVRVAVDYLVHHRKANGTTTPKVFKLTTRTLAPGERLELVRRHHIRPITTRRYHPGGHALELQVNGVRSGWTPFTLVVPEG